MPDQQTRAADFNYIKLLQLNCAEFFSRRLDSRILNQEAGVDTQTRRLEQISVLDQNRVEYQTRRLEQLTRLVDQSRMLDQQTRSADFFFKLIIPALLVSLNNVHLPQCLHCCRAASVASLPSVDWRRWKVVSVVSALLALAAKENGIAVLPIAITWDIIRLHCSRNAK